MNTFLQLREKYQIFRYKSFELSENEGSIKITYNFEVDGLCEFHPSLRVPADRAVNAFDSVTAKKIAFSLGMVELVSYWKAACPQKVIVECGYLDREDIQWWKKLYYNGLGEFFYKNGIETDPESFIDIECICEAETCEESFAFRGYNIVPVGGGKDSDVTLELLTGYAEKNIPFTVNSQQARTDAAIAAGYNQTDILCAGRTIDKELLRLNSEGFLNGHTPFSAIVAFLGYYCAYLVGAQNIVLSNESSANESNIQGTQINHQYSKSYEFERDFDRYTAKNFALPIRYFSLLRGFNELQIAKQFSAFEKYHAVFRSCNAGSKKNVWCCNCPKCLFVYSILSPFFERERLSSLFGCDMLSREDMKEDFDGLVGFSCVKPFECVGTKDEVTYALSLTAERLKRNGEKLPCLLEYFAQRTDTAAVCADSVLLTSFNIENNIPQEFMPAVKEMYSFVSSAD